MATMDRMNTPSGSTPTFAFCVASAITSARLDGGFSTRALALRAGITPRVLAHRLTVDPERLSLREVHLLSRALGTTTTRLIASAELQYVNAVLAHRRESSAVAA